VKVGNGTIIDGNEICLGEDMSLDGRGLKLKHSVKKLIAKLLLEEEATFGCGIMGKI